MIAWSDFIAQTSSVAACDAPSYGRRDRGAAERVTPRRDCDIIALRESDMTDKDTTAPPMIAVGTRVRLALDSNDFRGCENQRHEAVVIEEYANMAMGPNSVGLATEPSQTTTGTSNDQSHRNLSASIALCVRQSGPR